MSQVSARVLWLVTLVALSSGQLPTLPPLPGGSSPGTLFQDVIQGLLGDNSVSSSSPPPDISTILPPSLSPSTSIPIVEAEPFQLTPSIKLLNGDEIVLKSVKTHQYVSKTCCVDGLEVLANLPIFTLYDQRNATGAVRFTVIFDPESGEGVFGNSMGSSPPVDLPQTPLYGLLNGLLEQLGLSFPPSPSSSSPPPSPTHLALAANVTSPYGLKGKWVYLRAPDGSFLTTQCCVEGSTGGYSMLVTKPTADRKNGRFFLTTDGTSNETVALLAGDRGMVRAYRDPGSESIHYLTTGGDPSVTPFDPSSAFVLERVGVGVPAQVTNVRYDLAKAVVNTKFVTLGHQTFVNLSPVAQSMAMETAESVLTEKRLIWEVGFAIAPQATFTVPVPVAGSGGLRLGITVPFTWSGFRSYTDATELRAIFTLTVPRWSALIARAVAYYSTVLVPFTSNIIRYVPSPETGEPIPYSYVLSGIYRGSNTWNLGYRITTPPPGLIPGFPTGLQDPFMIASDEEKARNPRISRFTSLMAWAAAQDQLTQELSGPTIVSGRRPGSLSGSATNPGARG